MSTSRAITSSGSASSPSREPDRLQVAEPGHDRLQHARAPARRPTLSGPPERVVAGAGMAQAAQHRDPLADRVRAGREPLVRQRLPAGEAWRPSPAAGTRAARPSGPRPPARSRSPRARTGRGRPGRRPAAQRGATISGRSAGGATRSRSPLRQVGLGWRVRYGAGDLRLRRRVVRRGSCCPKCRGGQALRAPARHPPAPTGRPRRQEIPRTNPSRC